MIKNGKRYFLENTTEKYRRSLRNTRGRERSRRHLLYENGLEPTEFDSVMIEATRRCGHKCIVCYHGNQDNAIMGDETLRKVLDFSLDNSSVIFWSGGEPFSDERMLETAQSYQDFLFYAFTNGSLLDEEMIERVGGLGNLIPILGVEGHSAEVHNKVRPSGNYKSLLDTIERLHKAKVPWVCATVVTADTFDEVTSDEFGDLLQRHGALALKFHHYFPVGDSPDLGLILKPEQEVQLDKRVQEMRKKYPFPTFYFSDNKRKCGGFVYFDVYGNIKMCPYFHYSPANINGLDSGTEQFIRKQIEYWKVLSRNSLHYCPLVSNPSGVGHFVDSNRWYPVSKGHKEQSIIRDPYLVSTIENNYKEYARLKG
jgi:MoaA/NifB/PqqE/SkfB family radical SAM enzyme